MDRKKSSFGLLLVGILVVSVCSVTGGPLSPLLGRGRRPTFRVSVFEDVAPLDSRAAFRRALQRIRLRRANREINRVTKR